MKLIALISSISISLAFGQVQQNRTSTMNTENVTNKVFNKKTGEKLSESELAELFTKYPTIVLENFYDKYGKLEKAYFDPDNILVGRQVTRNKDNQIKVGEIFPSFAFTTIEGDLLDKELLLGNWIFIRFELLGRFLNKEDIQVLNQEIERIQAKKNIIGIICFADSNSEVLFNLKNEFQFLKIVPDGQNFHKKYSITAFPTSVLIGPDGKVVKYYFQGDKLDL
jgi:hypothetical protein